MCVRPEVGKDMLVLSGLPPESDFEGLRADAGDSNTFMDGITVPRCNSRRPAAGTTNRTSWNAVVWRRLAANDAATGDADFRGSNVWDLKDAEMGGKVNEKRKSGLYAPAELSPRGRDVAPVCILARDCKEVDRGCCPGP